jgi:hypothetical protein
MLDTLKLMKALDRSLPELFKEMENEQAGLITVFEWLRDHPEAIEALTSATVSYTMPLWEGRLDQAVDVQPLKDYTVLATDGSQIYPDKHQGVPCYVLNTGIVQFSYGEQSFVKLSSIPEIVTLLDDTITEDMVNCRRTEQELEVGFTKAQEMKDKPDAFLCDGSLIFWHLEAKSRFIKERFLKRYLEILEQFYQQRIPMAGYISMPKSKELIAILRNLNREGFTPSYETLVDTDLVHLFLKEKQRTAVFQHNSSLAQEYPDHLVPCFVYMHTGLEIARIEMPKWVAKEAQLRDQVLGIIYDQTLKGNGYPVSLSEAH